MVAQGSGTQGTNTGHWSSGQRCTTLKGVTSGGSGGNVNGNEVPPPFLFIKPLATERSPEAPEPLDAKFLYYSEILACTNFHLQNNNKNLI